MLNIATTAPPRHQPFPIQQNGKHIAHLPRPSPSLSDSREFSPLARVAIVKTVIDPRHSSAEGVDIFCRVLETFSLSLGRAVGGGNNNDDDDDQNMLLGPFYAGFNELCDIKKLLTVCL